MCTAKEAANLIAYKLQEIFGIIGYPKIFHTDNGKEFTAKVVLEFLWDLNPNILTVTGRPRRPSDEGSVENMNKFVKRTLGTVLAEYRLVGGKHPNWTEVLGSIASAINTQHGWGENNVSAYEAVYGQKRTMDSHVQRRKRANAGRYQNGLRLPTTQSSPSMYARTTS
jgi:transposase InsO family protein